MDPEKTQETETSVKEDLESEIPNQAFKLDETETEEKKEDDIEEPSFDEEETEKSESEEESEGEDIEKIDETELLKKHGLDEFVDDGGLDKALEDYSKGRKDFTQNRQQQAEINRLANQAGITGENAGQKLIGLVRKFVAQSEQPPEPQVDPIEEGFKTLLRVLNLDEASAKEQGWTKESFKGLRTALGIDQIMQDLGITGTVLNQVAPMVFQQMYSEFKSEYETNGKKVVAPVSELTRVLQENPEIIRRARANGQNPMVPAYRVWFAENGEDVFKKVYEAGGKKVENKSVAENAKKKIEKPGGKTVADKSVNDMSIREIERMGSTPAGFQRLEKIVSDPKFERFLDKQFKPS